MVISPYTHKADKSIIKDKIKKSFLLNLKREWDVRPRNPYPLAFIESAVSIAFSSAHVINIDNIYVTFWGA